MFIFSMQDDGVVNTQEVLIDLHLGMALDSVGIDAIKLIGLDCMNIQYCYSLVNNYFLLA